MRVICTLLVLLCAVQMSICSSDSLMAVSYIQQARTFALDDHLDSSTIYHQKALLIHRQLDDLGGWIFANKDLAKVFRDHKNQAKKALEYLHNAMPVNFGRDPQTEEEWDQLGWLYVNIGYTYTDFFDDYAKANENYLNAKDILVDRLGVEDFLIARYLYSPLGNINTKLGDYKAAEVFLHKFKNISLESKNYRAASQACSDLGLLYHNLNNDEKAIESYLEGINLPNLDLVSLGLLHGNLTKSYSVLGENAKALYHADQAIRFFTPVLEETQSPQIKIWMALTIVLSGEILSSERKFEEAEQKYLEARSFFDELIHDRINRNLGKLYYSWGRLYLNWNKPEEAICKFNLALQSLLPEFKPLNPEDNPDEKDLYAEITFQEVLDAKSVALRENYKNTCVLTDLEKGLECQELIFEVEKHLRRSYQFESSKLFNIEESRERSEFAIELAIQLWELTGNEKYKEKALDFAERSKSILLLEAFMKEDAEIVANIPVEMLEEEKELQVTIANIEKEIYKIKEEGASDSTIQQLEEKLLNFRQDYTNWIKQIEKSFPQLFNLKYNFETASVEDIRRNLLTREEALVEYFVGSLKIYVFVISQDRFDVISLDKDFPLEEWVIGFRRDIEDFQQEGKDRMLLCQQYTNRALELYQRLIAPIEEGGLPAKLNIIPSGVLGFLPFDVLLTDAPADECAFKNYPYLIHQYDIVYGYSASLQVNLQAAPVVNKKFLGFAPRFDGEGDFGRLQQNVANLETIASLVGGDVFLNEKATLEQFRAKVGEYGIIQLATHAKANIQEGDFSFVVFADGQGGYDSLFVRDIYLLDLMAELVVLSACETAVGTIHKGEGIISLARGFLYSGAKSILTTLWSINEGTNLQIVENYFGYLKSGKSKSKALILAKKEHINKADQLHAHPVFWAALVPIGNRKRIYMPAIYTYLAMSFGAIGLLFLFFLLWQNSRKGIRLGKQRTSKMNEEFQLKSKV